MSKKKVPSSVKNGKDSHNRLPSIALQFAKLRQIFYPGWGGQKKFAGFLEVTTQEVNRWENGQRDISRASAQAISEKTKCNFYALFSGEGELFPNKTPEPIAGTDETTKKNPYYKPEEERGNQGLSRGDSAPGGMVDKQRDDSRPRHPGRVGVVDVDGKHILKIPESCRLYDVMSHGPVLIDSDFRNVITDTAAQVHSGMLCRCEVFRGSHAGTYFGVVTIDEKAGKIGIDDIRIPKLRRMVIVDRDDVSIVKIAGLWFS